MNKHGYYKGKTAETTRNLYTPSPFARQNLFFLQETGALHARSAHISRREYLNSFLFLIISKGSGTVTYQNRKTDLHEGDCVFLNCIQPYSLSTESEPWDFHWVHFNGSTMPEVFGKFIERSGRVSFHASDPELITGILTHIQEISLSDSFVKDMELHQELSALLTIIMKDCWNNTIARNSRGFISKAEPVRKYLSENFRKKISLDDLAKRFFINKYYLTKLFRNQYGITISEYILDLRINEAKELLRFSTLTLEEIAIQCGFYDLPYFSRKFKKAEGISPSAFRNQWK